MISFPMAKIAILSASCSTVNVLLFAAHLLHSFRTLGMWCSIYPGSISLPGSGVLELQRVFIIQFLDSFLYDDSDDSGVSDILGPDLCDVLQYFLASLSLGGPESRREFIAFHSFGLENLHSL
ncbi:hypothetical protein SUGI_0855580 [Cryptomeria japonica]|nr:hypothetical protein SUGI_0855580 [Cryptomeria japonica]